MIYFISALILALLIFTLYIKYKTNMDKKEILMRVFLSVVVLFLTYISKAIFIYKPIFILHLALLILAWMYLFRYIVKDKLNIWIILSPALTTVLFFSIALFFKENA